jgi:tetratricopeptide (TPR) repeat protein
VAAEHRRYGEFMDRITRQKIKHDKFVDDVGSAYSYVRSHRAPVVWGITGAAAIGLLLTGFIIYRHSEESRAQKRLAEAISILDAPLESQVDASAPGPKYKTEQEKLAKAQPILQEVETKYPNSDAADIAGLYLARFAAERGDVKAARPKLEQFVRDHPNHVLAGAAQRGLYELRIGTGEGKQVIEELQKELDTEGGILPDDVLLALQAQAWELAGNAAKAKEAYQRIVNEFPDSPYTIDAQRKLFQG